MKINKKIIIGVVALIMLIAGRLLRKQDQARQTQAEEAQKLLHEVSTGDLQVEVKVTAIASLVDEQNLSFAQQGKINKVNVSVGDHVQAGDVLAELDMDTYYNAIQTAELELANAQLSLEKLLNNDTSVVEAQLQAQLNETKQSYTVEQQQFQILQEQLTTILQQKNNQLDQLQRQYDLEKQGLTFAGTGLVLEETLTSLSPNAQAKRNETITNIVSSLRAYMDDAEYVIETIDQIFGVSDTFRNQAAGYAKQLATRNTSLKRETEDTIRKAYQILTPMNTQVDKIDTKTSDEEIYTIIQNLYEQSLILIDLCDSAENALDMTSPGSIISEATLAGFTTTVRTARNTAVAMRTQLQSLTDSIDTLLLAYDTQRSSLQTQQQTIESLIEEIETLKKDNENQLTRKQTQLDTLSERKEVLQKELDDIIDGPDSYDIQQQRNLIRQAQLRLERTEDQKDDYQVIADFDGRVRTVDIVAGEQYELDNRKFIVVENPELIELELQVSQIDIVKITEGDPVIVTFDAHPNNPIQARVNNRNVNPESNGRGGFYYEAVILLEKQELEILAGMSALVTVITNSSKNTLLIPSLSLIQQGDKTYVYLQQSSKTDGGKWKLHPIKTGIMNNFQVEVLEGLKAGDIIKASALDDEQLQEMGIDDSSGGMFGK